MNDFQTMIQYFVLAKFFVSIHIYDDLMKLEKYFDMHKVLHQVYVLINSDYDMYQFGYETEETKSLFFYNG